ncbi:MAG: hypothetical protein M3R13_11165 [Armatimonadota bacterium]|nr:hypothetical protein [Armatimonadota bacterium]
MYVHCASKPKVGRFGRRTNALYKSFDIKWQRNYKDSATSASYDANDDLVVIASVFDVFRLKNGGKDSTTWLRTKDLDAKDIWAGTILDVTSEYALVDDSRRVCFAKISLVKQGQVERIGVETNNPIEKFMDARISEEDLALLGVDKSKKSVYLRKSLKEPVRKVAAFKDDVIDAAFGEGLSIFVVDALHRIWLIDGGEPRKLYQFTEPGRWVSRSSNRNGVAMWKGNELMLYQGGRLATSRLSEGVFLSVLLLTSDTALGTTGAPYDFVELKVGR